MLCSVWNSLCTVQQLQSQAYNYFPEKMQGLLMESVSLCGILGEEFKTVQKEVAEILKGRILVGHALQNDLKVH